MFYSNEHKEILVCYLFNFLSVPYLSTRIILTYLYTEDLTRVCGTS